MPEGKHRLLLLNPPAPQPVFRDCYCSGTSKGSFFIHPLDLQIQSGYFPKADFQLAFIDAVYERLKPSEVFKRVKVFKPHSILSLVGHAFFENDASFLGQLKSVLPSAGIYLTGDNARFTPAKVFARLPKIDGLLKDFGTPDLYNHIKGEDSPGVITPSSNQPQAGGNPNRFQYPLPQDGVINRYAYRLPFFKSPRYYSIATSFGCPFSCLYCNTHLLGYRTRPVEQVVDELYAASGHGFKSLYVRDATFLYDRQRTLRLFREWGGTGLQFEWICFTRPDLIDDEVAELAAELGCSMMMVGVESYDEASLTAVSRTLKSSDIVNAFRTLRKFGIRSAAQIIVGLHNSNPHHLHDLTDYERRLKDFLRGIDPDFVSLNMYHPRPGIPISQPILAHLQSTSRQCERVAKRINKYFYLRPKSLLRQWSSIGSLSQLVFQLKIAADLFIYGR